MVLSAAEHNPDLMTPAAVAQVPPSVRFTPPSG